MADSDARLAWRLFNLNWIPIAAMGGVFLLAMLLAGFSLEPVAFGFMCALVLLFGLVAYLYAWARGYSVEPKLIFASSAERLSDWLFKS